MVPLADRSSGEYRVVLPGDSAEHYATLKTSKPVAVGNESKGTVREIKLSAEKSGFLAAVGMSGVAGGILLCFLRLLLSLFCR